MANESLRIAVQRTATDTTLPLILHSAGVSGYNFRYVTKTAGLGADGTVVSSLPDVNGANALTAAIAGAASGPTVLTEGGSKVLRFDGATQGLGGAVPAAGSFKTVAMVYRPRSSTSDFALSGGGVVVQRGAEPNARLFLGNNTAANPDVPAALNAWHVLMFTNDGTSSVLVVDGVQSSQVPVGSSVGGFIRIRLAKEGTSHGMIDVAELISWPTVLGSTERAAVRTALKGAHAGLSLP